MQKGSLILHQKVKTFAFFFFFFFPCPGRLLAPWNWGVDCYRLIFVAQRTEVAILTRLRHPHNANTYGRISLGHSEASDCHLSCISDITYAIAQPTITSFPSFGWYSEEKYCHAFRTSRSNLKVKSVIAFERICIQDMNRGGNVCVGFAFIPNLQQVWWICLFDWFWVFFLVVSLFSSGGFGFFLGFGGVISAQENNLASNCPVVFG